MGIVCGKFAELCARISGWQRCVWRKHRSPKRLFHLLSQWVAALFSILGRRLATKGNHAGDNRLRLDAPDGSPWEDYRIENGHVEMRVPDVEAKPQNGSWRKLTPEQITLHVMRSTVVAQSLQRRIGVHALLRACTQQSVAAKPTEEESSQEAVAA